ncbi:MAG: tetratricopeptide repeat protein, partial [Nitrospira sp.]
SVADTTPVFEKILESCQRLFATDEIGLLLVGEDGLLHMGAFGGLRGTMIETFKKALELHRAVGDEEGLAVTYGQLGKTYLLAGQPRQAERCLNNACEHFIKLGNGTGETGALRLLADLYEQEGDLPPAIRCLERITQLTLAYRLSHSEANAARLTRLRQQASGRM